ncbi:hypothetical protein MCEMRE195_01188 [Candidatus Nanopelagicaceae bacterium]
MAKVVKVGDELILELSFWEKLAALHSSPRIPLDSLEKIEFFDELWGSHTLRGVRAPGTAIPYLILYATLRGRGYRDFVAMQGRGEGVVLTLKSGPIARWIFTLKQPKSEISNLLHDTPKV